MMSPKVLEADGLIFWFHRYDALHENCASVHAGKGSQNDHTDAKIWLSQKLKLHMQAKLSRLRNLIKPLK
jgi:hypothetical protein